MGCGGGGAPPPHSAADAGGGGVQARDLMSDSLMDMVSDDAVAAVVVATPLSLPSDGGDGYCSVIEGQGPGAAPPNTLAAAAAAPAAASANCESTGVSCMFLMSRRFNTSLLLCDYMIVVHTVTVIQLLCLQQFRAYCAFSSLAHTAAQYSLLHSIHC